MFYLVDHLTLIVIVVAVTVLTLSVATVVCKYSVFC